MLIYWLIRKYTRVAGSSSYRRQYPFSLYIFRVYLLYTNSYSTIIQYSSRLKLLNRGRVTLQFKCPQLYYTIISPFIAYPVTYRRPPFVSRVSRAGLQQLGFFTRIGLQPRQCFLAGVLLPVLLLVRQIVLLPGQVPLVSSVGRLSTRLRLPYLSRSPYRRFPVAQL